MGNYRWSIGKIIVAVIILLLAYSATSMIEYFRPMITGDVSVASVNGDSVDAANARMISFVLSNVSMLVWAICWGLSTYIAWPKKIVDKTAEKGVEPR